MEKITFDLFGFTLLEPLSTLMNWVLATQCIIYYAILKRQSGAFSKYWTLFFLAYGISLVFGGLSHLLFNYVGLYGKIPGWSIAILGVTSAEWAMSLLIESNTKRKLLQTLIWAQLFSTITLLFMDFSFKWVMFHTAGLFFFVTILAYLQFRRGRQDFRYFLIGTAGLLFIAIVKVAQFDIHPSWFTRDDIAHFAMLGIFWAFFKSIKSLSSPPFPV